MAIMSLQWVWQLIGSERRSAARPERQASPPMKIEVERLPDYRWRELGFVQARRSDEPEHTRWAARSPVNGFTLLVTTNAYPPTRTFTYAAGDAFRGARRLEAQQCKTPSR